MATLAKLRPDWCICSSEPENPKTVIGDQAEPAGGCLHVTEAGENGGQTLYILYRNDKQLRCPYCGAARYRLRSAGRREPYFACEGCGQRLET